MVHQLFDRNVIAIACLLLCLSHYVSTFHLAKKPFNNLSIGNYHALTSKRASHVVRFAHEEDKSNRLSKWLSGFKFWKQTADKSEENLEPEMSEAVPENAVLVFGATGKSGEKISKLLLDTGRNVVLAARNATKVKEIYQDYLNNSNVFVREGVDVVDSDAITPALFQGVTQVVCALGPVFKNPNFTAENVDFKATVNLIDRFNAARSSAVPTTAGYSQSIVGFEKAASRDLQQWSRLDDVIMGGSSSSGWQEVDWAGEGRTFARWTGELVTTGGGFCGTVVKDMNFVTEEADGIKLRVRGDGNTYKFRLKSGDGSDSSEDYLYQASFSTIKDQWSEILLPFDTFVAVRRNEVNYFAPKANKAAAQGRMSSVGFVFSRFEFNGRPNPKCTPGRFQLDVEEISVYRAARPELVLVSSAGTERINKLSNSEQRAVDIPIVQLNPQGILHWKYKAEEHLRRSGLPYSIIRATGLVTAPTAAESATAANAGASTAEAVNPDVRSEFSIKRRLQAGQGDSMVGRITRDELAALTVAALNSPYATDKTFEVRRDESDSGLLSTATQPNNWGVLEGFTIAATTDTTSSSSSSSSSNNAEAVQQQDFTPLFRSLVLDDERALSTARGISLPPFPVANDPPAPESPERVQQILNDPRVQAQQSRDRDAGTVNPNVPVPDDDDK